MPSMTIDRIFIAYMTVCGLVIAAGLIFIPHGERFAVPPFFWVLIPMAVFEAVSFARNKGAPGSVISPWARLGGFALAIALMMALPYLAGQPAIQLY